MLQWECSLFFESSVFKRLLLIFSVVVFFHFVFLLVSPVKYKIFPPCFFSSYLNLRCPACGGTRAFYYLFNGDFFKAIEYNLFFVLLFLGLLLTYIFKPSFVLSSFFVWFSLSGAIIYFLVINIL